MSRAVRKMQARMRAQQEAEEAERAEDAEEEEESSEEEEPVRPSRFANFAAAFSSDSEEESDDDDAASGSAESPKRTVSQPKVPLRRLFLFFVFLPARCGPGTVQPWQCARNTRTFSSGSRANGAR